MTTRYETVIGLEVHSQLLTKSKMFCPCGSDYQNANPNTRVCPVCMGMPGVLPVVNKKAVELVILTGLALGCGISETTKFDRKNYPYPDLMKGYQISQFDQPVAGRGVLSVQDTEGNAKDIGVTRVHLEEDVAKLIHRKESHGEGYTLLDINRAGVPLMEIVSEPDLRSPEEARAYLISLRSILQYIDVSTANMEEGNFRCDANISLKEFSDKELGSKVEIKNMNSFKAVYEALQYEIKRQTKLKDSNERIMSETRGWVEEQGVTVSQRSKEEIADYRYFPEPDLPPLEIDSTLITSIKDKLPELPNIKKARFISEYKLSEYDTDMIIASKQIAEYFESVMLTKVLTEDQKVGYGKNLANWIIGDISKLLDETGQDVSSLNFTPEHLFELIESIITGKFSNAIGKRIFVEMTKSGKSPGEIAESHGLVQISDVSLIAKVIDDVIDNNVKSVSDYLEGNLNVLRFLVGQVMKETKGKANPQKATELLQEKLESLNNR